MYKYALLPLQLLYLEKILNKIIPQEENTHGT